MPISAHCSLMHESIGEGWICGGLTLALALFCARLVLCANRHAANLTPLVRHMHLAV